MLTLLRCMLTLLRCMLTLPRCNALTGSESAVCLSVLQASSIQHLGVCCESITLGHNRFKLNLTANHITLPGSSQPGVQRCKSCES
jgi:hypothetical protein